MKEQRTCKYLTLLNCKHDRMEGDSVTPNSKLWALIGGVRVTPALWLDSSVMTVTICDSG